MVSCNRDSCPPDQYKGLLSMYLLPRLLWPLITFNYLVTQIYLQTFNTQKPESQSLCIWVYSTAWTVLHPKEGITVCGSMDYRNYSSKETQMWIYERETRSEPRSCLAVRTVPGFETLIRNTWGGHATRRQPHKNRPFTRNNVLPLTFPWARWEQPADKTNSW